MASLQKMRDSGLYKVDSLEGILKHEYAHVLLYKHPQGRGAMQELIKACLFANDQGAMTSEDFKTHFGAGALTSDGEEFRFREIFAESYRMAKENKLDPQVAFLGAVLQKHGLLDD